MSTTKFRGDSEPVRTEADLLKLFQAGEKTRQDWGVGTEHEKLGFLSDNTRLPYQASKDTAGVTTLLQYLCKQEGWQGLYEQELLIALKSPTGALITLEPGGQIELSGIVQPDAYHTCRELGEHFRSVRAISEEVGLTWLTIGHDPFPKSAAEPWVPKQRYRLMRDYLSTRGSLALDMMVHTCTVQVNLDYSDEADMGVKIRLMMLLTPLITALFAASPFKNGKPCGRLSERAWVWDHMDSHRCGFIQRALAPNFSYQDYVQYALDVPMFFIQRGSGHLDCTGLSFRAFMEHGLGTENALMEDWELHLTTLFPHVRLKKFLEWRPADMGLPRMVCALTALARGLFYQEQSLSELGDLVAEWHENEMEALQHQAIRQGLEAKLLGRPLRAWGHEVLTIAKAGLQKLQAERSLATGAGRAKSQDDSPYLEPLWEVVAGISQAERLLDLWAGPWQKDINGIFKSEFALDNQASSQQKIDDLFLPPTAKEKIGHKADLP